MERLTKRTGAGTAIMKAEYSSDQIYKSAMRQQVTERLAAYEETGLAPEDIPHGVELVEIYSAIRLLRKYEALGTIDDLTILVKARDDGRVVALPCKAGAPAWNTKTIFSSRSEPKEEVIDRFIISADGINVAFRSGYTFSIERIGKTIFLTRADAEAALKGEVDHEKAKLF